MNEKQFLFFFFYHLDVVVDLYVLVEKSKNKTTNEHQIEILNHSREIHTSYRVLNV